jgi:hypothetical protein
VERKALEELGISNMDFSSPVSRGIEARRSHFMAEPSISQARKIRERFAIELRSQRRSDALIRKRTDLKPTGQVSIEELTNYLKTIDPRLAHPALDVRILSLIEILTTPLESPVLDRPNDDAFNAATAGPPTPESLGVHLSALTLLRAILTLTEGNVDFAVELGVTPVVLDMCKTHLPDEVVTEAAWCLCNLVSGSKQSTETVVQLGGVEVMITLTNSMNPLVLEQAVWAIGNVIGDEVELRDLLLGKRLVFKLKELTDSYDGSRSNVYPLVAWTCSNTMRRKPSPEYHICLMTCNILSKLSSFPMTDQLTSELLGAIVIFTEQPECEFVRLVLSSPLFPFMLRHFDSTYPGFIRRALSSAGNIVLRTDPSFTTALLKTDFLDKLCPLLGSLDAEVRRTAYWVLSNTVGGTRDQVMTVMNHALMEQASFGLIDELESVVIEASFVLKNISSTACDHSLLEYVRKQPLVVDHLVQALTSNHFTVLENLLIFSSHLINKAKEECAGESDSVLQLLFDKGCMEAVQRLVNLPSRMLVTERACDLLSEVFEDEGQVDNCEVPSRFNFS